MFGNRKPRIPVSKDDIKAAVLNANNKFKKQNKKLKVDIENAEKQLKDTEGAEKVILKEIATVQSQIDASKIELSSARSDVSEVKSQLNKANTARALQERLMAEVDGVYATLTKKNNSLEKSVSNLEVRKAAFSIKAKELKELESNCIDKAEEYKSISNKIESIQIDMASFEVEKVSAKAKYNAFREELASKESSITKNIKDVDKSLEDAKSRYYSTLGEYARSEEDRKDQIEVLDSLVKQKETEYITIEGKLIIAKQELVMAKNDVEQAGQDQIRKVEKIKSGFQGWKLKALEEVAKLKLKGKIENIDKAGLTEILNG